MLARQVDSLIFTGSGFLSLTPLVPTSAKHLDISWRQHLKIASDWYDGLCSGEIDLSLQKPR